MKRVKVVIEFEMKGDAEDEDTIKESIYDYLEEAMECDELEYTVDEIDEDEEEDL